MFQSLEPRVMLTSSLSSSGTLTVTGTNSNNSISLHIVSGKLRVAESGLADKYYTLSKVKKISIDAKDGNDSVKIDKAISIPASIVGGAGKDSLAGGIGKDTINGGTGTDTVDYSSRASSITASIKIAESGSRSGGGGQLGESDSYSSIERIVGGSGKDKLTITGGSASRTFPDLSIILTLEGRGSRDNFINGSTATLHYPYTIIKGGDGNDTFQILSGQEEEIRGEAGDNYYFTTPNSSPDAFWNTSVIGGSGWDWYDAIGVNGNHRRSYTLPAGLEQFSEAGDMDVVFGNDLNNIVAVDAHVVYGGKGNDRLISNGLQSMILEGDAGNDTLYGSDAYGDALYGGEGNDALFGKDKGDELYGNNGNDTLHGNEGDDRLEGGAGTDQLYGDAGNDTLFGSDGITETLHGGDGQDKAYPDSKDILDSIELAVI